MKNSCRPLIYIVFLAIVNAAFAQAPKTLSYQGTLSDSSGLLNGPHNLTFSIYDAASAGTNLWTETSLGVMVVSGNVSLILGKLNPIDIQTVKPLWMGITVDSNPEISPRVELSASLYSIGLALPYSATVSSGVGDGGQLMNLTYDGDSSVAILRLNYNGTSLANPFVLNHTGTGAAMVVTQSGTLGTGTIFSLTDSANPQPVVRATTFGTGNAGVFRIGNVSSTAPAVSIQHSGTGNAITANRPIQATQFIGDGSLLTGVSGLTLPYATNVSNANGNTSLFDITYSGDSSVNIIRLNYADSSSLANPFVINHAGQGAGLVLFQTGTLGTGGIFSLSNSANPQPAVRGSTFGTGSAGVFQVNNPSSTAPAINITNNGTGNAITANRPIQATQFIGDGSLLTGVSGLTLPYSTNVNTINGSTSLFDITYSGDSSVNILSLNYADSSTLANPFVINHAGQGAGLVLFQTGTLGTGGIFSLNNSANPQPAIRATTFGTGHAGNFQVNNPGSSASAINISHSGTGNAITANRPIQATQFIGDGSLLTNLPSSGLSLPFMGATSSDTTAFAITGNGSASAASFSITNDSSSSPGVQVLHAGTGEGIYLNHVGHGVGMAIVNGSSTNPRQALAIDNLGLGSAIAVYQANAGAGPALSITNASGDHGMRINHAGTGGSAIHLSVSGGASPALDILHVGTGNAITANRPIQASQFIGDGSLLTNLPSSGLVLPFSASVSDSSALFSLTNTDTGSGGALDVTAHGTWPAIFATAHGTGAALFATTHGTGPALFVAKQSSGITAVFGAVTDTTVVDIRQYGSGYGLTSNAAIKASQFIGDGSLLTNLPSSALTLPFNASASDSSTVFSLTNTNTGSGTGTAGPGALNVTAHGGWPALFATAHGTGAALFATTHGTGPALFVAKQSSGITAVFGAVTDTTVVDIRQFGSGLGLTSNAPIKASQLIGDGGNEPAVRISSGGLRYNVAQVVSSSIATRSTVYRITSGGVAFALAFSTSDGDTCIAFNDTGAPITVGGVALATGETRQLIYLGGAWRGL